MRDVNSKNIWIIGASSGIGRALAVELSSQGATLALSARTEDDLKSLNDELGGHHMVCPLDVSNADKVVETAKDIKNKMGVIDSVIFMAAVYTPVRTKGIQRDDMSLMIDVNIKGAYYTIEAALPILRAQETKGQLVLCGSVAGYRGLPSGQPYSSTKAAVNNLAESLRVEEDDIDIKLICPGFVKTRMTDKNDFPMPMRITPEKAAKHIVKGLQSRTFEIHFPKAFTTIMKLVDILPRWLYIWLAKKGRP